MRHKKFFSVIALCSIFTGGCATDYIKPSGKINPPPAVRFSEFRSFELKELTIAPEYAEHAANQKAARKIEENLRLRMDPLLQSWNGEADRAGERGRLVIEPELMQIKFIGGAARFWAGAIAGSSAVTMKVTYRDGASGDVIAEPNFYQHANAWGGAYSFGSTDNLMLSRISELIAEYTKANYLEAVGGSTGAPP